MNIDREKALEGARAIGKLDKPDAALVRLMLEIQKQAAQKPCDTGSI